MRTLTLMIPLFYILLTGCGENSSTNPASAESKPASDKEEGFDACELLNEKLIRSHFEVGVAEVTSHSSVQRRYSNCTVSWPRPNKAEIQAEYNEKITEYGMAKAKGEDVEMPEHPRDPELILTTFAKSFDDNAQAISALDSALDILKYGLKSRPKDPARVLLINVQPVEDVGDKAGWTTPNNQLSVANGRRIFHLIVKVDDDSETNRVKAVELAGLFLKDIR